jgi:hypothetical protein
MGTARDSLPHVDIVNVVGLHTKTNPDLLQSVDLQSAKNLDFYTEYGSVCRFGGTQRHTTKHTEGGSAVPVSWIGFYKSQDFAGQIIRKIVYQAGTKMFVKETTGLTGTDQNAAVQPSGLFRDHDMFERFMLITGQDPFITGTLGSRYKFDGFQLARWGVDPPGREETVFESFNSASGFTTNACTVATETSIAFRGSSVKITKDAGSGNWYTQKVGKTATAVNTVTEDRAEISVYIPEIEFRKLRNGDPCMRVWFSSEDDFDTVTGTWLRYDFRIGEFSKGWNTFSMDFSVFPSGDLGDSLNWNLDPLDLDDERITAIRVEFFSNPAYNADEINFYVDHCIFLDQGAPLVTAGSSGSTFPGGTGATWTYVITYENQYGHESNQGVLQPADIDADASTISTTVIYNYDDHTDGDLVFTECENEATNTTDQTEGAGCIEFGHSGDGAGDDTARVEIQNQSFDFSTDVVGNLVYLDVYIAADIRAELATDGIRVKFGDNALDNYYEWRFNSNTIEEGDWTTVTIDTSDPDIINGEVDLTDIENVAVEFVFKDDNADTTLDTDLKIDNLRVSTTESYASWELSEIPVSSDPDVTKRHIYRTVANGTTHFYVGTINDNSTTTYSDTVSDSSLGVRQPPMPGQFHDNSIPPNAGIVKVWKNTVFLAGDPKDPNVLYFSRDALPEAFPIINGFELDSPIRGIFETNNGLIVTTDDDWWRVIGDNPDYYVDRIKRNIGNVGFRACGETRLYGWAHDTDCIRLFDLADTNRFSEPIGDKIKALNKTNLKDAWSIYSKSQNSLFFCYPDANGNYSTCYVYQHMLDNVNEGRWFELDMPSWADFQCAEEIEMNDGTERLLVGNADGAILELGGRGIVQYWQDDDGSVTSVEMEMQTIYMRAGQLGGQTRVFTGRWKPAFIELRGDDILNLQDCDFTVTIDSADGSSNGITVRDTQSVTITLSGIRNLQRIRLKDFVAGEYCRVKVACSESFLSSPKIQGVRLYVEPRPGQFVVSGDTPGGRS